jgi:carboxyl-terminal processing protease
MRSSRYVLLTASIVLVVAMLGSGLAVRVGAEDGSYRETVKFAEILSTILDYYVDPVEADALMRGAYEGMLGGLDANGAYLTADEVEEWRRGTQAQAGPGISVLKVGRTAQVVAVHPESSAADAGVEVGDHVRRIDARSTRDLSLLQTRRMIGGDDGSEVQLDLLRPGRDFETLQLSLVRGVPRDRGYSIDVQRGVAILRVDAPDRIERESLVEELDDIRSRGVSQLLLDLRNASEQGPRDVVGLAACFGAREELRLRDAKGRVVESIRPEGDCDAWSGDLAVLINGATAGAAEALAQWLQESESHVYGESSYGLGAEPKLYEMEDGAGLLVSAARWETVDGTTWNETGIAPDTVIEGEGKNYAAAQEDQLKKVLEQLEDAAKPIEEPA